MPALTRDSDGKEFRLLDMTSKGRLIFEIDESRHDTLHQILRKRIIYPQTIATARLPP